MAAGSRLVAIAGHLGLEPTALAAITEAVMREETRAESPLNAIASCEQVAWAVTMLLAPEAEVITGSTLSLDYGRRRGLP